MVAGSGSMAVLQVTDPRSWSAGAWAADVVPHVAYGLAIAATYAGLDNRQAYPGRHAHLGRVDRGRRNR